MSDERQKVAVEMHILLPKDMSQREVVAHETSIKTGLMDMLRNGVYPLTLSDVTDINVTIVPAAAGEEEWLIGLEGRALGRAQIIMDDVFPTYSLRSGYINREAGTLLGEFFSDEDDGRFPGEVHLTSPMIYNILHG